MAKDGHKAFEQALFERAATVEAMLRRLLDERPLAGEIARPQRLAAAMRENGAIPADLPVIRLLSSAELDLALGRTNVVHAALLAGPASRTFLARWRTLDRFGASDAGGGTGNDI